MNIKRIRPIVIKEFRQIRRDKRSLGVLLILPAFLVLLIGYALNFDVRHVLLAVWDQDRTSDSRELIDAFIHNEYFTLTQRVESYGEIEELLGEGQALVSLVIPPSYSRDLASGGDVTIQVLVDGANANTATTVLGYVNIILQSHSAKITAAATQRLGRELIAPIDFRPKVWYNPELVTAKFLVPGLIGFILMISAVVSTSLSVVKEKERGTMEQLMVSPLTTTEIIIGKTIPYLIVGLVGSVLVLLVGFLLFDIAIRGSIVYLYAGIFLFLIAALGQGLLISTIAQTQQVAFIISVFSSLLPTFLLSGFVFPIRSMPLVLQILSNATPAKYFLILVRSVVLKGAGLSAFWEQFVFLLLFALVMLGISSLRLRKRVS